MEPDDLTCPICAGPTPGAPDQCPRCQTALVAYWRMAYRPWKLYGEAVERAAEGRYAAAARSAYAAVSFEPRRSEFRLLLARLLTILGEADEAWEHARAAYRTAGDPTESERVLDALQRGRFAADALDDSDSERAGACPGPQRGVDG
jgi:hypothetical protein